MSDSCVDINVLTLSLHGRLVGYLTGSQGGRNVLSFAEAFNGVKVTILYGVKEA